MLPSPSAMTSRWRFHYAASGLILCLVLISWGGVVTSIEAGLAVPDWPSSFGSLDPFVTGYNNPANPDVQWWQDGPVLAEHGHRLLGALAGLWIIGLALWTFLADPRRWIRIVTVFAIVLVLIQGVLGGLRVLWLSTDLAVVHAMGAQLFFCTALALTLFNSKMWLSHTIEDSPQLHRLRNLAIMTTLSVYLQILLGALLRHPGSGMDVDFVIIHATGSVIALSLIVVTFGLIRAHFADQPLLNRGAWVMLGMLIMQMVLGILALIALVYDSGLGVRSVTQVVLSSSHLVIGTILMGSCACILLGTLNFQRER